MESKIAQFVVLALAVVYISADGYGSHGAGGCVPRIEYVTKYKVKDEPVVLHTTVFKKIPTKVIKPIYVTKYKTDVSYQYLPQIVTQTEVLPDISTKIDYKDITKTVVRKQLRTDTVYVPQYNTKTHYRTVTKTKHAFDHKTVVQYRPRHIISTFYATETDYVNKIVPQVYHVTVPVDVTKYVTDCGHY